ncbi:MAG TPA: class I lanthipeptide [Candidatus Deferrimicrobium sp.]|nr:class I lanthipeptide [Candidatus Kapabacteria bacterium]HLP62715.1 class I lanthipeptide [Candidatus Deferrimicrobium sp.]
MKKHVIKKLELSKETIANLGANELSKIKGGYITASCPQPESGCATNYRCSIGCPSVNPNYC